MAGNLLTKSCAYGVDHIRKSGGKDDEVKLPLTAAVQDHLVFGESLNEARLHLDVAIDNLLASTGIEIEPPVPGLT